MMTLKGALLKVRFLEQTIENKHCHAVDTAKNRLAVTSQASSIMGSLPVLVNTQLAIGTVQNPKKALYR